MQNTNTGIRMGLYLSILCAGFALHAQTWSFTGSMETPRANQSATLLQNGQVLVAGGRQRGNYNLSTAEIYNPSTGKFTSTGSLNTGRNYQTATLLENGQVLITGGATDASGQVVCLASAELYNPSTGKFTVTGSMKTARCSQTATLLNSGMVPVIPLRCWRMAMC